MVVERNIKRFLEGTDENRNPHNVPFRYIDFPDEPNHDDEDELLDELLDVEIDAYVDALLDCDNESEASRLRNSFNFMIEIAEESGLDVSQVLGRISNRILERHESEPDEPENEPMPEPEYDEPISEPKYEKPIPEYKRDINILLGDCMDELVYVLTHNFSFNNDDDLRTVLMHAFNNEYPPECDDVLRGLIDEAIELIERGHFDINELLDDAIVIANEQRRYELSL